MFKITRTIRRIVLLAVILILFVLFGGSLLVDGLIKGGVEKGAARALTVPVSIGHLDLSVFGGEVGMKKLVIDNLPGYEAPKLMTLDSGSVKVKLGSLLGNVVEVEDIQLDGAHVTVEQKGLINNNLQELIRKMPSRGEEKEPAAEPSGKKLHIGNLELTNITVTVKFTDVPGKTDNVPLKLPPIRMQDLGGKEPMTTADLTARIMTAIAKGVTEQATGILPDDVIDNMQSSLGRLNELGGSLKDRGKELLDKGVDAGKKISEGIGGLFKKDEEQ